MNSIFASPKHPESSTGIRPRPKGLIVFCETNLRYERGLKAWIFLGPYFLGAVALELVIGPAQANAPGTLGPWIGFLVYLVLFPPFWRRVLRLVTARKVRPLEQPGASTAGIS